MAVVEPEDSGKKNIHSRKKQINYASPTISTRAQTEEFIQFFEISKKNFNLCDENKKYILKSITIELVMRF